MSTRPFFRALLFSTLVASSLNASAGLFDDEEARKDIKNLRAQVEAQVRETDGRIQKQDESIKNLGIIQLLNQIDQLNGEIAKLRGQIEVMANLDEQLTKRQRDFYLDIDTRLRKLETPAADAATPAAPAASAPSGIPGTPTVNLSPPPPSALVPTPASGAAPGQEARAYDVGWNAFRRGDYLAATRAFQTFIKDYAASPLVPNAHYWTGMSYFNLRDYGRAMAAQDTVLKQFPESAKAPDALLALASVYAESGDSGSARNALEDVIAKYPASDAATKARSRLPALRR